MLRPPDENPLCWEFVFQEKKNYKEKYALLLEVYKTQTNP